MLCRLGEEVDLVNFISRMSFPLALPRRRPRRDWIGCGFRSGSTDVRDVCVVCCCGTASAAVPSLFLSESPSQIIVMERLLFFLPPPLLEPFSSVMTGNIMLSDDIDGDGGGFSVDCFPSFTESDEDDVVVDVPFISGLWGCGGGALADDDGDIFSPLLSS